MNVEDYRGERIAINYDIKDYTFEILRVVVICIYHDVIPKIHIIFQPYLRDRLIGNKCIDSYMKLLRC